MRSAKKVLRLKQPSRVRKILLPVLGVVIAIYGLIVFIQRDSLTYMLVRTQFVFLILENRSSFLSRLSCAELSLCYGNGCGTV